MSKLFGLIFIFAALHGADCVRTSVNPVEKVIELLVNLQAKTEEQGKVEAKQYDEYACMCKSQADEKQYNIERSTKKIEKLTARIQKYDDEIKEKNTLIADLFADIKAKQAKVADMTGVRLDDHTEYVQRKKDTKNLIGDVNGAMAAIKVANLHVQNSEVTFGVMKSVKNDLKEDLGLTEEREFNASTAYDEKKLGLQTQIKFNTEEKNEATRIAQEMTEQMEADKASKTSEEKSLAADSEFLQALTLDCENEAKDYDSRSSTRTQELSALAQAIDIMKSGAQANYNSNKRLVGLQKSKKGLSFMQIHEADGKQKLISHLLQAGKRVKSSSLAALAVKIQLTNKDAFVKVRQLIDSMVQALKDEQQEDDDNRDFCTKEIGEATSLRDTSNAQLESALAAITKLTADIDSDRSNAAELSKEISAAQTAKAEATKLRNDRKEENTKVIEDSTAGEAAVKNALKVLNDFYGGAKNSDSSYQGDQDSSKGIIGMMEVIQSDFERTKGDTTTQEEDEAAEFETLTGNYDTEIQTKDDEKFMLEGRISENGDKLSDRQSEQANLKATLKETGKELKVLRKKCIDNKESYEEKVEKRKQEIQALKDAFKLLDEWQG